MRFWSPDPGQRYGSPMTESEPPSDIERCVVEALRLPQDSPTIEHTIENVAGRASLTVQETLRVLRALESREPSPVHRERDATLEVELWWAIEPGTSDILEPEEGAGGAYQ